MEAVAMKKQEVKLKLVLTEGYEKRFTEAVCKVFVSRNKQLTPPRNILVSETSEKKQTISIAG